MFSDSKKILFQGVLAFYAFTAIPSIAQDATTVADIAKQITVKIEGATQGSGVLISSNKGIYTVLTAWHVLESNVEGEEIDIITNDGEVHQAFNTRRINAHEFVHLLRHLRNIRSRRLA